MRRQSKRKRRRDEKYKQVGVEEKMEGIVKRERVWEYRFISMHFLVQCNYRSFFLQD